MPTKVKVIAGMFKEYALAICLIRTRTTAMPELPEVEVICRGIRSFLVGRTVTAIRCSGKKLRHPVPMEAMQQVIANQKITSVERRAKFLQLGLETWRNAHHPSWDDRQPGDFPPPTSPPAKHDHVLWLLDNGTELRYNDTRSLAPSSFLR